MDIINQYLQKHKQEDREFYVRPRITCMDGFSISVQAHYGAYCSPRVTNANYYYEVECGFPSDTPDNIMRFAETPENPTKTVYGYVPVELVAELIESHGGIAE